MLSLQPGQDPYCFVEFADNASAGAALNTMNGREVFGKVVINTNSIILYPV